MKMFKKLMAVVLTGVMAVSMLTGCSLSDAAKASALEKSLNSTSVQSSPKVVTYDHNKDLDSRAAKVWSQVLGTTDATRKTALGTNKATTSVDKFVYDSKLDNGDKKYAYIIVSVGTKEADIKKSDKIDGASLIHGAAYKTSALASDISTKTAGSDTYTVKNAVTSGTDKKVKFGVKFYEGDKSGSDKQYYAIVVVEVTKN